MKIALLGSTGGIGRHVLEQALDAGHEVTALARRPEAITIVNPCLHVVKGDALDYASVRRVVAGNDAVISALGVTNREPTTLYSQGARNALRAMDETGVNRFLCISASGLDPGMLFQRVVAKVVLWRLLKHMYTDLTIMEQIVRESSADWTIVRPPRLTDNAHTGHYRVAIQKHLPNGWLLSRADVADYLLKAVNDRATYQALIEIAY
jgi:putative NADH-flavin reductase